MRFLVHPRWVLIVGVAPFVVLGLLVLTVKGVDLVRYDPAFFAPMYQEQYGSPGDVARTLETALKKDDRALMAELEGLRRPVALFSSPNLIFVMLWERSERYITYLYFDMHTYERHPHYIEEIDGRWVVSPQDLHYYLYSGQWKRIFFPLAIVWWILGGIAIGLVWMFRASRRMRERLLGE